MNNLIVWASDAAPLGVQRSKPYPLLRESRNFNARTAQSRDCLRHGRPFDSATAVAGVPRPLQIHVEPLAVA
jgi:hypothetical protein